MGLDTARNGVDLVAVSTTPEASETFQILRKPNDSRRVRFKASNGFFLQVIDLSILGAMQHCNLIK